MKTSTLDVSGEFNLTLIDSDPLPYRLATELHFIHGEIRKALPELKRDPIGFLRGGVNKLANASKRLLFAPNAAVALLTALFIVTAIALTVRVVEKRVGSSNHIIESKESDSSVEIVKLDIPSPENKDLGVGLRGKGRVGFQRDKGEGSSPEQKRVRGGGAGGLHEPLPVQNGKLPPPSLIAAEIPKAPPINKQVILPAGIDIDPALWQDLKPPVYGDPRSASRLPSNGSGDGGGMGTNQGTGIGDGRGPGVGPGFDGNMGGDSRQFGSGGASGSSGNSTDQPNRVLRVSEVEQRARLVSKPEPHYTEEARRNQITGTVVLRVVFSGSGEVVNIHAVSSLPFGLTERAIAAARQIKFMPATRGGRPVSVYMQLEYNFNLY